jgi:hypothetical protein
LRPVKEPGQIRVVKFGAVGFGIVGPKSYARALLECGAKRLVSTCVEKEQNKIVT